MSCVSQQVEHWVVRLIRQCGLCQLGWTADANMFVCTQTFGNDGKGATAYRNGLGLTHMVDNQSIFHHVPVSVRYRLLQQVGEKLAAAVEPEHMGWVTLGQAD